MQCKICPICGTQNDPRSMECSDCGYDLMGTPVVDPEQVAREQAEENAAPSSQPVSPSADESPSEPELVRVCPCGEENPPQLRKCRRCHEDISDILPTPKVQKKAKRFVLEEIGTKRIFPVPDGTTVIGRESAMRDTLASKRYVSRIHAKITTQDGKLYIENLSGTNYTYVNNQKIPDGRTELSPGDEVGLGGMVVDGSRQSQAAYFLVGTAES